MATTTTPTTAATFPRPSVKDLRSKFDRPAGDSFALSPSAFEKYRREQSLRSAAEIKSAKEKAQRYNAALRKRTLKRNQIKTELAVENPPSESLITPRSQLEPASLEQFESTVLVESRSVQTMNPTFEMPLPEKSPIRVPAPELTPIFIDPFASDGDDHVPVQREPFPGDDDESHQSIRATGGEEEEVLDTGASVRGDRRSSTYSGPPPESSATPQAYEWIRRTVLMNKPSTGDLLLTGGGERHYSMTSVGPKVEVPVEDVCRLDPGVDVRTLLTVFYQTYAPEKLPDIELVLNHFRGRREALLFTLECKYLVTITPDGRIEPQRPFDAYEPHLVEDEVFSARRASQRMSAKSDISAYTDLTTNSFKGYAPVSLAEGGMPSNLLSSWAVPVKHNSGQMRRGERLGKDRIDSSGFI